MSLFSVAASSSGVPPTGISAAAQLVACILRLHDRGDFQAQLGDHRRRCPSRGEERHPHVHLVRRHAGLGHGRHVGQDRPGVGPASRQPLDLASPDLRVDRGGVDDHQLRLAGQDRRDRGRAALAADRRQPDLGHLLEQLGGDAGNGRARAVLQLVGVGLHVAGDELAQLISQAGAQVADADHDRRDRGHADRRESRQGVGMHGSVR